MAPLARANSRIPFTELWLSNVSRKRLPGPKGYDSPTSFSAWLALVVKMTAHSSGDALKNASTRCRTRAIDAVEKEDVGLVECGLPKT